MQKRALDENVRRISEMCKDEKVLTLEEAIKWAADIMEHVGDGFDTQAVTLDPPIPRGLRRDSEGPRGLRGR